MRKMNCAKFNFDVFTKTLTISKTFERNAAIYQSTEQKMMKKYMEAYGDALTIRYYKPRNAVFRKEIRCIHVYPENRLVYEFYDGHTKEAYWKDPSRRDSWTPEMKARAAEQMRRRYAK